MISYSLLRQIGFVLDELSAQGLLIWRADLAPLLRANPALPERLGDALARRIEMNQAALAMRPSAAAPAAPMSRPTLVDRIWGLFGLHDHHERG